jgi:hypothetical protein
MAIDPEISQLWTQFGEVVARNAATSVTTRVTAIRARRADQEAVNELTELVNDLIADRNELIGIATAFQQELIAQRISDEDIQYITTQLIPVAERLITQSPNSAQSQAAINAIKGLVNQEALTILQLIGFNFRRAIGDPLTVLVERLILARVPDPSAALEIEALRLKRETAMYEAVSNPEAQRFLSPQTNDVS